ncbi:hypothetical protein D3C76_204070 [compost metagenome]
MKKRYCIVTAVFLTALIILSGCSSSKEEVLTLDKLRILSEKKDNLSWNDFDGYPFEDIGFGLYIRKYNVADKYQLLISGNNLEEKPIGIYLAKTSDERIDIRYEDIDRFILASETSFDN